MAKSKQLSKKLNKRQVKKLLAELEFDPTTPENQILIDVDNADFYVTTALLELQRFRNQGGGQARLREAVKMVALAYDSTRPRISRFRVKDGLVVQELGQPDGKP